MGFLQHPEALDPNNELRAVGLARVQSVVARRKAGERQLGKFVDLGDASTRNWTTLPRTAICSNRPWTFWRGTTLTLASNCWIKMNRFPRTQLIQRTVLAPTPSARSAIGCTASMGKSDWEEMWLSIRSLRSSIQSTEIIRCRSMSLCGFVRDWWSTVI